MTQQAIPLAILDERLAALNTEINRLSIERELLLSLRSKAISMSPNGADRIGPIQQAMVGHRPQRPTLTDTVVDYVRRNPGLVSSDISDGIIAEFAQRGDVVGGSDPRKTLLTTVGAQVQKGRIRRDSDGRHYVL